MPKQTITVQMDADKVSRLRVLSASVAMHLEAYCAMILDRHIQRNTDVDSKGEHA